MQYNPDNARKSTYLRSEQGVQICLNYMPRLVTTDNTECYKAYDPTFIVEGYSNSIRKSSFVMLRMTNRYLLNGISCDERIYHVKLVHHMSCDQLNSFTGLIDNSVDILSICRYDITSCIPQIALIVDGVQQIDPIQPDHNNDFNFSWKLPHHQETGKSIFE